MSGVIGKSVKKGANIGCVIGLIFYSIYMVYELFIVGKINEIMDTTGEMRSYNIGYVFGYILSGALVFVLLGVIIGLIVGIHYHFNKN